MFPNPYALKTATNSQRVQGSPISLGKYSGMSPEKPCNICMIYIILFIVNRNKLVSAVVITVEPTETQC